MGLAVETIQLGCSWSDMTSNSTSECNDSEASSSDTSCVLSLSYSASDACLESMNSARELELYLHEPVASTDDTPVHDDDSQNDERLLTTN